MKFKAKFYLSLSFLLGILLSAFMTINYYNYVDPSTLLVTSSAAVTVLNVFTVLSVLFVIVAPLITMRRAEPEEERENSSFIVFCSSLLGFLFAGYFISFIISPIRTRLSGISFPFADISALGNLAKIIYFITVVLAVPCAVYFIVLATKKKISSSASLALLSSFPVIWFALRLIYYFMQTGAKVNVAGRRLTIVTLCLCTVFFLCEAKLYLGAKQIEEGRKVKKGASALYIASGCGAILTLFATQVSTTLLQAFWLLPANDTYILSAIFITLILYITSRIYTFSCKL